jgi:hypothetical protein
MGLRGVGCGGLASGLLLGQALDVGDAFLRGDGRAEGLDSTQRARDGHAGHQRGSDGGGGGEQDEGSGDEHNGLVREGDVSDVVAAAATAAAAAAAATMLVMWLVAR